MDLVDLVDADF